ncbi:CBO0543 family protein [Priestia aryabhattai]|uniref:CBO0543 family protein n=1 Tax=Priestia aryabhattai TaxID=412384 RepID=UPI00398EC7BD
MFIQNKKIILNFTRYNLELFSINFIFPTHFYISNRQNIAIFSSFLDMIGDFLGLWDYRYEVFPLTSNYLPWDLFLLPIPVMFFIQVKPKIKPVIKALIYSALASFIGLPLLNWIGVYKQLHWRYIYSFPILIVIYIAASYIASKRKFEKL